MVLPKGHWLTLTFTILMAIMTVWSGAQYVWANRTIFKAEDM